MLTKRLWAVGIVLCGVNGIALAQEHNLGSLTGSIENNSAYYLYDSNMPEAARRGINTYTTLKYTLGCFSAMVQAESYAPPLRGYDAEFKGNRLTSYNITYRGQKLQATLGTFYEQLGSGIVFRAYEERSLGINNALRGINLHYSPTDWLHLKAFSGQPRRYLDHAHSLFSGGDAELSLLSLLGRTSNDVELRIGGSVVHRLNTKEIETSPDPKQALLWSLRSNLSWSNVSGGIEYTAKGAAQSFSPYVFDFLAEAGDALLINLDYSRSDFGVSASFRRIEHIDVRIDNEMKQLYIPMNYLPALTKQHKYALPSLYPHQTNSSGEVGTQVDMYGNLRTEWLGKYPLKWSLNAAYYQSLGDNPMESMPFFGREALPLYAEVGIELSKKLSRATQITLGGYYQKANHNKIFTPSFAQVVDLLWKPSRKFSLRSELQHMTTEQQEKGWLYALIEVGFASHFSLYASDMYSYKAEQPEHFYMAGGAMTYGSGRLTLGYGRTRAGMQCVGGICRFMPEYTGFTLGLSWLF